MTLLGCAMKFARVFVLYPAVFRLNFWLHGSETGVDMALLNVDWECVDSAAIRCYGRTGQLGAVRRLWQQLTKAEVSPSVFTFNSLLDGTYFFELIKGAA
jgi:pentatricopeptide repeat protein